MKKYFKSIILIFFIFVIGTVYASYNSDSIRMSIVALYKTKMTILKEFNMQNMPHYSKNEIGEFKIFLDYINGQINYYCSKLNKMDDVKAIKDLPCNMNSEDTSFEQFNEISTSQEQLADMDDKLITALGDFDEMLLIEEKKLNNNTTLNRQNTASSELENYLKAHKNKVSDEKSTHKGKGSENIQETDSLPNEENAGDYQYGKSGNSSAGSNTQQKNNQRKIKKIDDDIVARQLREAAEKEMDPELKEKLWEEYDKYKQKNK